MGGNQSSNDQEEKRLQDYVNRQQPQVNQYYSQNQQISANGNFQDDDHYHNQNNQQDNKILPQVQITKTVAVKSEIYLLKSSLKAIRLNQDLMGITFKYTSEFPANVSIYLCARETVTQTEISQNIVSIKERQQSYELPAAKEAEFPNNYFTFQLSQFNNQELTAPQPRNFYYPLIIKMERIQQTQEQKKSIYYCQFQIQAQKVEINCFRTKLEQSGQGYVLNDVYGIHESCLSGKSDKECCVCMSEKINTMIMPCKHMCLCNACCEDMRKKAQKCPMCRGDIQSFMQLESIEPPQQPQYDTQVKQNPTTQQQQNNPYNRIISTDPNAPQYIAPQQNSSNQPNNFQGQGRYIG